MSSGMDKDVEYFLAREEQMMKEFDSYGEIDSGKIKKENSGFITPESNHSVSNFSDFILPTEKSLEVQIGGDIVESPKVSNTNSNNELITGAIFNSSIASVNSSFHVGSSDIMKDGKSNISLDAYNNYEPMKKLLNDQKSAIIERDANDLSAKNDLLKKSNIQSEEFLKEYRSRLATSNSALNNQGSFNVDEGFSWKQIMDICCDINSKSAKGQKENARMRSCMQKLVERELKNSGVSTLSKA